MLAKHENQSAVKSMPAFTTRSTFLQPTCLEVRLARRQNLKLAWEDAWNQRETKLTVPTCLQIMSAGSCWYSNNETLPKIKVDQQLHDKFSDVAISVYNSVFNRSQVKATMHVSQYIAH